MDKGRRFLCDEMLVGLGKWLRAAGYDTLIAEPGADDAGLLALALREGRTLITRDRSLLQRKGAAEAVFLLNETGMENWVRTLSRELGIDWCRAPFSRCLLCNSELVEGPGPYADLMPDYVLAEGIPCFHCPDCAKPYWRGGHVQRMRRRLQRWRQTA